MTLFIQLHFLMRTQISAIIVMLKSYKRLLKINKTFIYYLSPRNLATFFVIFLLDG